MHPLTRTDHLDAAIRAHPGDAGFGLQISMFLGVGVIDAFNDHVRLGKARFDVAVGQRVFEQHVGVWITLAVGIAEGIGVQRRRVGRHRRKGIGDDRQRFIVDHDCLCRRFRLGFALRHDQRHVIGFPPHNFGLRRAVQAAKHRLIGHDQAVFIDGHIGGGQHSHDARHGACGAYIHRTDASVRRPGKDHFEPRLIGQVDVAGVDAGARHFFCSIDAGQAASHCAHNNSLNSDAPAWVQVAARRAGEYAGDRPLARRRGCS